MSVSLNIRSLRLLQIEVYKDNEMIYKGKSDDAPPEIKQLNAQVAMMKLQKGNNEDEDSSYDSCDGWDIRP